jgi:NADH dehydrogenase (ubiquinone) Fe-S protein 1
MLAFSRHAARRAGARAFHSTRPRLAETMTVSVNGQNVDVPNGVTVLQACEEAGAIVPRFCYHDRLSIAGNCRMCLVEVEKSPKPVASCAMPAMPGMKIFTETDLVHKAREGVMEFLLANHPLDCPICDQGGECDLQDMSMSYGSDISRFREWKRGVEDKNIGPLVKTVMTRCIHCTRCVRFSTEVAGVNDLGTTGRGNAMEIGTYVSKVLDTEMSGNVIDLCPVGALTSKPFAFTARPWELTATESIDAMDAVGSNIRIDTMGVEIMRVVPRLNEDVNEEWIADKSRFSYDGLKRQRLDTPLVKKGNEFVPVSWKDALLAVGEAVEGVKGNEMVGVVGEQADAESIVCLKDLLNRLGCSNLQSGQQTVPLSADVRSQYLTNTGIAGVEDADALLIIGSNPRMEAPIVNTRIRKTVEEYGLRVANVGPAAELTYGVEQLGDSTDVLQQIIDGSHPFAKTLAAAERPMVLVGLGALKPNTGGYVLSALDALRAQLPAIATDDWNGLNILHTAASRVAAQDLGFVQGPGKHAKAKFAYLLEGDEAAATLPADCFVVYQGHHGDAGATRANIILPGAAYTEKTATYVNTEGRVQRTKQAADLVGDAREDWKIIRAVSEVVGAQLPYNSVDDVRARLVDIAPHFANVGEVEDPVFVDAPVGSVAAPAKTKFEPFLDNYFMTDPISRASKVMGQAAAQLPNARNSYATA